MDTHAGSVCETHLHSIEVDGARVFVLFLLHFLVRVDAVPLQLWEETQGLK